MGITGFSFSCCCEKLGSKLLGVEWSRLLFCFSKEYTFLYFQVIFCFLFNYHAEANLFSFSRGDGTAYVGDRFWWINYSCAERSPPLWLGITAQAPHRQLSCAFHLSQQHAPWFILKDQKHLVWVRGMKRELWQRQCSRRALPLGRAGGQAKADPARLHGSTMWGGRSWCK